MSRIVKKIYYYDTDCGGVVYYANYLKYFEEARTEYMLEKGVDLKELADKGILFVVKKADINYKSPACYGDVIEIFTHVERVRSASLEFTQEARKGDRTLVLARICLACIDDKFRPRPIPEELNILLRSDL
jgi:acyl-CoA thioester hydrolase